MLIKQVSNYYGEIHSYPDDGSIYDAVFMISTGRNMNIHLKDSGNTIVFTYKSDLKDLERDKRILSFEYNDGVEE